MIPKISAASPAVAVTAPVRSSEARPPVRVRASATTIGCEPPSVTIMTRKLEAAGLVHREPAPVVFAVFSVVQPALLGMGFGRAAAYPVAVLGSATLVLACAQIGLRGRSVAAAWQ